MRSKAQLGASPATDVPARRTTEWLNLAAVLLAVALSTQAARSSAPSAPRSAAPAGEALPPLVQSLPLAANGEALSDATGVLVPRGPYRRIVSGSLLADPILLELCAPEAILAFSARARQAHDAQRYSGKPSVDVHRIEDLLALRPDLVLINSLGEQAFTQKLRDAGLVVFDLGRMRGVQTFLGSVLAIGWLTGHLDSAREFAGHFQLRLEAIARHLPLAARRSALYVGVHGSKLYGGTRGTSYHDVLSYAGLVDVAARDFQGWPSYDPEQLLLLDPEIIVTQTGGRAALCERSELARLQACTGRGQVIELDSQLLDDAGLGMLEASELVHLVAYPAERAP